MPLEKNTRFWTLNVGVADQDAGLENDDQNFTFCLCFEMPLCFPRYHMKTAKIFATHYAVFLTLTDTRSSSD